MSDLVYDSFEAEIEAANELRNLILLDAPGDDLARAHEQLRKARDEVGTVLAGVPILAV